MNFIMFVVVMKPTCEQFICGDLKMWILCCVFHQNWDRGESCDE